MATKTIGLREEVYERLRAQERSDESFTDTVDRLLAESKSDWRAGFGTLQAEEAAELEAAATTARERLATGVASRQRRALDTLLESTGDGPESSRTQ